MKGRWLAAGLTALLMGLPLHRAKAQVPDTLDIVYVLPSPASDHNKAFARGESEIRSLSEEIRETCDIPVRTFEYRLPTWVAQSKEHARLLASDDSLKQELNRVLRSHVEEHGLIDTFILAGHSTPQSTTLFAASYPSETPKIELWKQDKPWLAGPAHDKAHISSSLVASEVLQFGTGGVELFEPGARMVYHGCSAGRSTQSINIAQAFHKTYDVTVEAPSHVFFVGLTVQDCDISLRSRRASRHRLDPADPAVLLENAMGERFLVTRAGAAVDQAKNVGYAPIHIYRLKREPLRNLGPRERIIQDLVTGYFPSSLLGGRIHDRFSFEELGDNGYRVLATAKDLRDLNDVVVYRSGSSAERRAVYQQPDSLFFEDEVSRLPPSPLEPMRSNN